MTDPHNRPSASEPSSPSARQRAIEAYEGARDRASDTLGQAPLLALAGGIAAGALIAALLPRTKAETKLVRPTAKRLKAGATAAFDTARTTSRERFNALGFSREKGEETYQNFLQAVKDTAQASADAAVDAVRKG